MKDYMQAFLLLNPLLMVYEVFIRPIQHIITTNPELDFAEESWEQEALMELLTIYLTSVSLNSWSVKSIRLSQEQNTINILLGISNGSD